MLLETAGTCDKDNCMGVSLHCFHTSIMLTDFYRTSSTPAALQYEKFIIPDAIRILDGIVQTLMY